MEIFLFPNPWNYFPLNIFFGAFGWILNLIFPISWILWDWSANLWNSFAYSVVGLLSIVGLSIVALIVVPSVIMFTIGAIVLLVILVLVDGPVMLSIILFFVAIAFILFVALITSPIWLTLIGILVPFDKIFYAWLGIMMFILFWEVILPWFGMGLQTTEIQDVKSYDESEEFEYYDYNM